MLQSFWETYGSGEVDHAVMVVYKDRMPTALEFFVDLLGWKENDRMGFEDADVVVRFVEPKEGPATRVQLTMFKAGLGAAIPGVHLGLRFDQPYDTAKAIRAWSMAMTGAPEALIVPSGPGKYFVELLGIFRTKLEIVPFNPMEIPDSDK